MVCKRCGVVKISRNYGVGVVFIAYVIFLKTGTPLLFCKYKIPCMLNTVSLRKRFGSKGKQLYNCKASETQSQIVIPPKTKINHGVPPGQLRPGINICLTTTDPCLPIIAWKCNDAYSSWSSQLVPRNLIGQSFLFICLSLAVWLCLKKCSENRVLVVLLQIGATDLTVAYQE